MVKAIPIPTISSRVNKSLKVKKIQVNAVKAPTLKEHPKKVAKSWIARCFYDFATNTALHGYNHIVREDTTKWERRAWSLIVIVATIVSIVLLWISWNLSAETPTLTVIETTNHPIGNIHFPAVTICNMNKIAASRALNLAKNFTRPDDVTPEHLSRMFSLVLHFQGIGNATKEEYDKLHSILQQNKMNVLNLTKILAPSCSDMLERCRWKGTDTRCDELFQTVETSEGFCCSFNYYGTVNNSFPPKIAKSMPKSPRKMLSCGYQTGLTAVLTPITDEYHSTFFSSFGVRVFVHDSYTYCDDNAETIAISAKTIAFVNIFPESTYCTTEVRRLLPETRQCLFADERKLNYFRQYTYVNCLAECRAEIVLKLCGCVPYHMPNNGSARVCEMSDMICALKHKNSYNGALPGLNRTVLLTSEVDFNQRPCDCLADCEINEYPTETTSANLNRTYTTSQMSLYKGINITDHSTITVSFADLVSTHNRKDIYQNWLSLLASFGGLLGLLLGFSFVTGFELIYFFTIRVFFDNRRK